MKKLFVPLHLHTDASFLDSMSTPPKLVARAKELGYTALAVTDHGNTHNFIRMHQECKKADIKFIPGCEFYFTNDHKENTDWSYHITILAQNNKGLKNLYRLTTWSNVPVDMGGGFYRRPRTSWKELERYSEGLICLTGCMNSPVNQTFLTDGYRWGKKVAQKLHKIFGNNLVVEIQNVNENGTKYIPEHDKLMKYGRRLADDLGLRRVATNDSHYIMKEDERAHEVLKCISTGNRLSDAVAKDGRPGRIKFRGHDYHLKSDEEMRKKFDAEEIDASADIADSCNVKFKLKQNYMPRFDTNITELEAYNKLVQLVKKGWYFWKFYKKNKKDRKTYIDRLRMELKDIQEAELTDYFLIVWDAMKFVDDNKIGRGFSRGSAGGSLVSYCLKVCLVDPIEYGLYWERFWNRGRKGSMPDVDLDICVDRRDEVITYLRDKFGKSKVFPMMTVGKFKPKVAIKDVGKAQGLSFDYVNVLGKKVPPKPKSIEDAIERSEKLAMAAKGVDEEVAEWKQQIKDLKKRRKQLEKGDGERFRIEGQLIDLDNRTVERSNKLVKTFEMAKKLEMVAKQRGKHACALLISNKPVMGRVPLVWDTKHKSLMTAFDMRDLENMGYLKLDVLGLATATLISRILPNGIYDIIAKGFEDKKVFNLIGTGNCKGIFQLESHLGRKYAKMMKPVNLEEVSDLVSILRPGILETGLTDQYLKNRRKGSWKLVHEDLRPIFDPTYGIMCYQEQMLEVVKTFGGFDLSHADLIRKACGKKLPEEMEKHEKDFTAGCESNKYEPHVIDKLWEWINAAADYTFNKSHGVGYGMMTYATAYLKCHHTLDFFTVLLQMCHYSKNKPREEISEIFYDAKLFDIKVIGPSLRLCNADFKNNGKVIQFGMKHIRNIGDSASQELQKFKDANWAEIVINRKRLKKQVVEALIYSGSLDYTNLTRLEMIEAINFANAMTDKESAILESLLLHGRNVTMGKKIVKLGKAKNFYDAVETIYEFLEGENREMKAITCNRAEKLRDICATYLDSFEPGEEMSFRDKAGKEILYLGIPATCSEVDLYEHKRSTHTCIEVKRASSSTEVCVIAVIMDISRKTDRKGKPMAFIKLADKTYMIEGMMFSQAIEKFDDQLQEGKVVLVKGKKSRGSLLVDRVKKL